MLSLLTAAVLGSNIKPTVGAARASGALIGGVIEVPPTAYPYVPPAADINPVAGVMEFAFTTFTPTFRAPLNSMPVRKPLPAVAEEVIKWPTVLLFAPTATEL